VTREAIFGPDGELTLDALLGKDPGASLEREWLVTNGIGGYAMGTVANGPTRRYHALLVAATRPPAERTVVLGRLEERLVVRGERHDLATGHWADGTTAPRGYVWLRGFRLERGLPVWRYAVGEATLEKRIAMVRGANAVLVEYRLLAGSTACELELDVLVANRPHHVLEPDSDWTASGERRGDALLIRLPATPSGGMPDDLWVHLGASDVDVRPRKACWRGIDLPVERDRGYDARDAQRLVATLVRRLEPGRRWCVGAQLGLPLPRDAALLLCAEEARRQALLDAAGASRAKPLRRQAILASDDFLVRRHADDRGGSEGWSIIAGYPWFADWSRDTLLALPGLLLATGRLPAARELLTAYASRLSAGMLPNRFPDRAGEEAIFNAVDAPLLFIRAVVLTALRGGSSREELAWLRRLWPALRSIVDRYEAGTRYGIRVDPADGLVAGGEPGVQLTWMDAKVDGRVVTPRIGKPVEVNALWYAALRHLEEIAPRLGEPSEPWGRRADRVRDSFRRFVDPERGDLVDVLDGPAGTESALRPNQVLAAGLEHSPLDADTTRAVVAGCAEELLVGCALRTLAPHELGYRGRYEGDVLARDEAYHQGSAWPWPIPFLVRAALRAGLDERLPQAILDAFAAHLPEAGVGSVSELFDGDAPHAPRGCPAQAWSVAALLETIELADAARSAARELAESGR
jgi:glycogen debranching enzyme